MTGLLIGARFKRILLNEEQEELLYDVDPDASNYELSFELSKYQKEASDKVCDYVSKGYDVLLNSVCGSGKTEIVVKCIKNYINKGLKVCYAISRKEVVIELAIRYKKIFKDANIGHFSKIGHEELVNPFHDLPGTKLLLTHILKEFLHLRTRHAE